MRAPVAALVAVTAAACGGAPAPARAPAPPASAPPPAGPVAPDLANEAGLPSLDALAARGASDAPLMREALRVPAAAPRSSDVRADKDTCLRAVFAASSPARVRARFADESGAPRGDTTNASSGTVPPRGPVCAKKGEALHLVIESDAAVTARAVIFAAP